MIIFSYFCLILFGWEYLVFILFLTNEYQSHQKLSVIWDHFLFKNYPHFLFHLLHLVETIHHHLSSLILLVIDYYLYRYHGSILMFHIVLIIHLSHYRGFLVWAICHYYCCELLLNFIYFYLHFFSVFLKGFCLKVIFTMIN